MIPDVEFDIESPDKRHISPGKWKSKAILNALEGIKRTEMFANLRQANNQNTITKKMAILNGSPNVFAQKSRSVAHQAGAMSHRLPVLNEGSATNLVALTASPEMKPPSLK